MIFVEDDMKFDDKDDIHIVCELCQKVQQVKFSTYKERMKSEYSTLECNKCHDKMMEKPNVRKCNFRGCLETFTFIPYFFKVMGFTEPVKCKDCRQFVEDTCVNCNKGFVDRMCDWKKYTKDG
jgi:hypothetical protein